MHKIEPTTRKIKHFVVILCILTMAATLTAGLWPFSFHMDNEISWKAGQRGLHFGDYGMVVSNGIFHGMPLIEETGATIEIWMQPGMTSDSNTILSFFDPGNNTGHISVQQSGDDLIITKLAAAKEERAATPRAIYVDHVFRKGQNTLLTLSSKGSHLDIYVNGILKKSANNFAIEVGDFYGTLVLGNSPFGNSSWMGTFLGLAFYDRAMSAEEVRRNYLAWRDGVAGAPNQPYSRYMFDEEKGEIIHNSGKSGPDLIIPKNYFIFEHDFLTPFWQEFRPDWGYVKDVAINVLGLVPLGFCFAALLAWQAGRSRSLLYVTIVGFCVSLTIEILQAFMPTRYSGTTDLITNTSGTALGGILYLNRYTQRVLERLGLIHTTE
jgi:VanZ family protein